MMEKVLIDSNIITSRNEIALISGGPPCPAFSMMGRSKISNLIKTGKWEGSDSRHAFIDDPRVKLFTNFVDYVRYFTPELFLMENVSGMNSFKQEQAGVVKPIIEVIRTEFDRIGYAVKHRTVNASSFGVPQNRKRVIFLGWKKGAKEPEYPTEHRAIVRARDAINDLPPFQPQTERRHSKNKQGFQRREHQAEISSVGVERQNHLLQMLNPHCFTTHGQ